MSDKKIYNYTVSCDTEIGLFTYKLDMELSK